MPRRFGGPTSRRRNIPPHHRPRRHRNLTRSLPNPRPTRSVLNAL
ncbi:hypothetical protein [Actinomadura oligospora]|nr:hypothetical protein [Actinomadura oligospora]